jgi:hypothetical protein
MHLVLLIRTVPIRITSTGIVFVMEALNFLPIGWVAIIFAILGCVEDQSMAGLDIVLQPLVTLPPTMKLRARKRKQPNGCCGGHHAWPLVRLTQWGAPRLKHATLLAVHNPSKVRNGTKVA